LGKNGYYFSLILFLGCCHFSHALLRTKMCLPKIDDLLLRLFYAKSIFLKNGVFESLHNMVWCKEIELIGMIP